MRKWLVVLVAVLAAAGASDAGVQTPAALQLVVVEPTTDMAAASDRIRAAGGRVELTTRGHLQALVPRDSLRALERDPAIADVAPAPIASADAVTSGGVARIGADALQSTGLRGAGVKIVVLDTAFGNPTRLDTLAGTELPLVPADHRRSFDHTFGLQGRNYVGTYSAHGEEVAEIVYDVASAAEYWYVNYRTADEFGQAFQYVASLGPDVVVHSNSFLFGPFDGSGWFAKKVDEAAAQGILWVNSAGNYRLKHWEGPWADGDGDSALDIPGHGNAVPFAFSATSRPACDLSWTNPDVSGTDRYALAFYLDPAGTQPALDAQTNNPIVSSFVSTPEPHADIPPAFLAAAGTYYLRVKRVGNPSGERLTLFCRQDLPVDVVTTASSSPTPGDARGALSVGAFNVRSLLLQDYSTEGPTDDGRTKPDLAAPTNVAVVGGYFGGTSAAAPHVAGEAALIWNQVATEGLPGTVAGAVGERLRAFALDMGAPGRDLRWGLGRTRVDTTPPALGATSPTAGQAVAGVVPLRLPLVEAGTFESTTVALDGMPLAGTLGPDHALSASFDSRRLADGAHHVTVAASDKSGNAATFDLPLRVDNSPPALAATQPAAGAPVSRVVLVRFRLVDPAGITGASATLDGAPLAASLAADGTLTASFDSRGLADGVHHVTVRTADSLGNAAVLHLPLLVDNTAPRVAVVAGASALAGAAYRVGVRAVDDLAGLSAPARVSFGDGAASAAPATHRYRRSGPHRLRVTVTDRAGNEAVVSRTLRVVELRLAAPRHGAMLIVTLGRPNVVRIAAARVRLRRVLSAGRHRLSLGRLGRGRHVVTAEARGFRARTLVRVP